MCKFSRHLGPTQASCSSCWVRVFAAPHIVRVCVIARQLDLGMLIVAYEKHSTHGHDFPCMSLEFGDVLYVWNVNLVCV